MNGVTLAIHSFHTATLPMLEALRSRLPVADQASAHIATDCFPGHDDMCAIQMTVRPEVLNETLVLAIVVSIGQGHLDLDVQIQDLNNSSYAAVDLLHPVSYEVVADLETAIRAVEDGLPRWVPRLVPLLDRERVYAALPFAPDWQFRSQSVSWFDRENESLGGRTPAQAIADGDIERVVEVAKAERA